MQFHTMFRGLPSVRLTPRVRWTRLATLLLACIALPTAFAQESLIVDSFAELSGWRAIEFEEGDTPSSFEPFVTELGESVLRVRSDDSSSMLILEEEIDTNATPLLTWRWQLLDGLETADLSERRREDAAIRIVVSFRNDLEDLPWWLRIWAAHQERRHGEVPPTSAIMYAWAARPHDEYAFPIPYTDRIQIVPVETAAPSREWREVTVNIRDDHRALFGGDPPEVAFVAVMSDSDNTGEAAEGFVGFLRFDPE